VLKKRKIDIAVFHANTLFGMGNHLAYYKLVFLAQVVAKLSKYLTLISRIVISVKICFMVMFNYVYFVLITIQKEVMKRNR